MLLLEQAVKLGPLVLVEQADRDALQEIRFIGQVCKNHAVRLAQGGREVQSFFIPPRPACIPGP